MTGLATARPGRDTAARSGLDRAVVTAVVLVVAAGAWFALAIGAVGHDPATAGAAPGPAAVPADHQHGHGSAGSPTGTSPAPVRLAGWGVMVLAMMLPPALPLVANLRAVTRRRRTSWALTVLGTASFTAPWIGAGAALIALDLVLGTATPAGAWMARSPQLLAGIAAIAAGGYQFTPAKRACLTACRSPRQLVLTEWHGREPAGDATRIGLRYGVVCVGCCWALMLLTLAVGWPAMPVMVVLAAAMAAERLLPRARPLVPGIAMAAIALGIALLVGIVPAGHIVGGHP